jgi:catechol 2,3-dioxygenase
VHLQVGAIPAAEAFYSDVLGFTVTSRYPGGTFYAADGYHHHLTTNIWNSRGAKERDYPSTGLASIEIISSVDFLRSASARSSKDGGKTGALTLNDPWGTAISIATLAKMDMKD